MTVGAQRRSEPIPFRRVHPDFARRPTGTQALIQQLRRPMSKHSRPNVKIEATAAVATKSKRARSAKMPKRRAVVLEGLEQINLHAAGIDVGSAQNFVCVPAWAMKGGQSNVRSFGAFTKQQDDLVEWLKECGITTVAMEATGIYWMSLYDKLEAAGIEVVLVDPHSVKHVPGRKSDVLDCQWLQQLHTYGLLRAAFRPEASVRRLRVLCRHRADLVCEGCSHLQQAQKALVQMNIQLPLVVSDINGETGLRIIEAILQGERNPQALVKLRDPRIKKSTVPEMEAALTGHYTEEHLFVLRQNIDAWKFYQGQMAQCDQQIEAALKPWLRQLKSGSHRCRPSPCLRRNPAAPAPRKSASAHCTETTRPQSISASKSGGSAAWI